MKKKAAMPPPFTQADLMPSSRVCEEQVSYACPEGVPRRYLPSRC